MASEAQWLGSVGSEGGPILVADVQDYPQWTGANDGEGIRIHYYGRALGILPAELIVNADEWHQVLRVATPADAERYIDTIRQALLQKVDGLEERHQQKMDEAELRAKAQAAMSEGGDAMSEWLSAWRDHMEGGIDFALQGQVGLHIDAHPVSAYSLLCDALCDEIVEASVGESKVLGYELEGSGLAHLYYQPGGNELLIARWWVDDKEGEQRVKEFMSQGGGEEVDAELGLELPSGTAAIVWSPVASGDLRIATHSAGDAAAVLSHAKTLSPPARLDMPGINGIGTVASLQSGRYRARTGFHEEEDWRVRWLRLRLEA